MAKTKIRDQAACVTCGDHLWTHPRCWTCDRFIWCGGQDAASPVSRHRRCPV